MEKALEDLEKKVIDFEGKKEEEEQGCVICMSAKAVYLNKNCGHLTLCEECSKSYKGLCPICNKKGKYMKLYVP